MYKKCNSILFAILFFFLNCNFSYSEIVKKIEIFGNTRISNETINIFSGIKINDDIDQIDINKSLKLLYETNFFNDVSISFIDQILKISVTENPIIEKINYNGIKSQRILELISDNLFLKDRSSFNQFFLDKDKSIILEKLKDLGYYFAEIEIIIENILDNKVVLTYNINLNQKVKISKITFIGNKIFKDRVLRNIIVSEEFKFWKFISGKKYLNKNNVDLDERLLKNFYLNRGYYDVQINSSFAKLIADDEFEIIFNINANNEFFFGDIILDLPNDFDKNNFTKLDIFFNEIKNEKYSINTVSEILDLIDEITINEQYESIKASVNENIINNKINLTFKIEEIEKYFIEKINILGNNVTRENVIRNQFALDEGDPFNEILLSKTINNLKSLNFFKDIKSTVKEGSNSLSKVVDIEVVEKPTGEISAGAGFGTSGATATFGVRENNYLGKGITLETNLTINEESLKGDFYVSNPNFQNSDKSIYFNLQSSELDRLENSGYKSSKTGFGIGTTFEYLNDYYLSLSSTNFYEQIDTDSTASLLQKSQEGNYWDSFFKINIDYDKRNQKFKTSKGFRSTYGINIPLISETNTFSTNYDYKYFTQLLEDNLTSIAFSFEIAKSLSDNIKLSERLYVPSNKLRGFERGKIGPKDGSDFIGGNYMSSINLTTTIPNILENNQNIDILAFADLVNLWGVDYTSNIDDGSALRSSVGFGIDWFTVIGPLNFTIAAPITKNSSDITETFRFNIGTTF